MRDTVLYSNPRTDTDNGATPLHIYDSVHPFVTGFQHQLCTRIVCVLSDAIHFR